MPLATDELKAAQKFIPNLRVVSEHLVRGGQPEPQGLAALKKAGVRTVVSLNGGSPGLAGFLRASSLRGESSEAMQEVAAAEKLGLRHITIPLDVFADPPMDAIEQFLAIVAEPEHHAVFLHCLHGRDRTGLLSAIYRVVCDKWSADRAYAEMLECGFDMSRTNLSDVLFVVAKRHNSP